MTPPVKNKIKPTGETDSLPSLQSYKLLWYVVLVVGLLQTFYALGFITKTSLVVEGQRYFCLFDDAMISMRYAANWADGHGFVWNQGERIEGYTTFAWTAIMGLCHLVGLSPSRTCLLVQILAIPILWSCLIATALLAKSCRLGPLCACCAVVLTATFYNLIFFTLFGMETGLLTALVTFALADAVKSIRQKQGRIRPMLWFAPAALVRPDILPLALFVFAFLYFSANRQRRRLIAGLLIVASVVSIHFLWRHHYYGQWLPNTYYLKATGWPLMNRLTLGIRQTLWTAITLGLPTLLALIVLCKPKPWHFLLLGNFAIGIAYQIYVGGDAWPLNRFVLPMTLGIFVLAAEGIHHIIRLPMFSKTRTSGMTVRIALTLLCVIAINAIHWDHCLLLTRPQTTNGNRMNIRYALAVEKIAQPDASAAVTLAGVFPYFSQRICIDILGKCDRYIARLPANLKARRAGHNKFDPTYSLNTYKPDVVVHPFGPTVCEVLYRDYRPVIVEVDGTQVALCVRKDSQKVKGGRTVGIREFNQCLLKMTQEFQGDF